MTDLAHIRNFSIVAHIDHGKSTLADRLIQSTGTVKDRDMKEQLLDAMDIERERGITIKANTVRIDYFADNGEKYVLNLIDTPGHVDFAYEVSRSMRAVEGSLLVVDSTQGVEAQTLANVYQAIDADHEIVPVLNKIDLPASDCDRVAEQIEDVIGIDATDAIQVSAKTGQGIHETLEAIVKQLPAPQGNLDAPLKAMLVDLQVVTIPVDVALKIDQALDITLAEIAARKWRGSALLIAAGCAGLLLGSLCPSAAPVVAPTAPEVEALEVERAAIIAAEALRIARESSITERETDTLPAQTAGK